VSPTEGKKKPQVFLKETRKIKSRREMKTLFRRRTAFFHQTRRFIWRKCTPKLGWGVGVGDRRAVRK
jgi:hypothetical protein